jgi:hypothetical protein
VVQHLAKLVQQPQGLACGGVLLLNRLHHKHKLSCTLLSLRHERSVKVEWVPEESVSRRVNRTVFLMFLVVCEYRR